jgi:hypothetical protein
MTVDKATPAAPVVRKVYQAFGLMLIFGLMYVSLCYIILSISVNSGRISHLQRIDGKIQEIAGQISRDPQATEVKSLQEQLVKYNNARDSGLAEVEDGNDEFRGSASFLTCAVPHNAGCFLKNASETNNLFLALAGGVMGACLYLLLGIYRQLSPDISSGNEGFSVLAIITFLPMGMMVGLATLFAIRGTKGVFLAPIADVVQLENPYGIAFVTTLAAFASIRVLTLAAGLVDSIPNLWKAK